MTDPPPTPTLRLAIGTPLNIQLASNANGGRLTGRLIGMLEGSSIIVHLSAEQGQLTVGDKLTVRCLEGRGISGFRTTVIEAYSSPYPHFHLSYPSTLDRVEVRQSERVSVAIPVTVRTAAGADVAAEVRDLSASGALLIAAAPLGEPGQHVELELALSLGEMSRTLQVKGSVRNSGALSQTPGSAPRYRCGLQFLDLADPDRLFLLGFVYERLAASRGLFAPQTAVGADPAT